MRPRNPWKRLLSLITPARGRSERKSFSLGTRPIHGKTPQGKERAPVEGTKIPKRVKDSSDLLKEVFHVPHSSDVVFREIVCAKPAIKVVVAYIEGLADSNKVQSSVLEPLLLLSSIRNYDAKDPVTYLKNALLPSGQVEEKQSLEELVEGMIAGDTVVLMDGREVALTVETKGWEHRTVSTSFSERIVKGPQQGFVEVLRVNTAIVRSILQSADLVVENIDLGATAYNRCAMLYMKSIANDKLVAELRRRLKSISFSDVLASGVLEQMIEGRKTLIPSVLSTERPDRVARFLLQGSCAVMVAGDPFVLILPVSILAFVHSPEDEYVRWPYGNLLRLIRYISLLLVVFLPGVYVAIVDYHAEMIPTQLLMAIAASREPIPFPIYVEMLVMYFGFELIREAGIRIPSPIGPTIGIVGALLIGEAAVSANLVSPIMVIVIAITAVAAFAVPNQELAMFTRIATLLFIIAGTVAGLLGVVSLTYLGICHFASLTSLGVPLLAPIAPVWKSSFSSLLQPAAQDMRLRQTFVRPKDKFRAPDEPRLWDIGETASHRLRSSVLEQKRKEKGKTEEGGDGGSHEQGKARNRGPK